MEPGVRAQGTRTESKDIVTQTGGPPLIGGGPGFGTAQGVRARKHGGLDLEQ